MTENLTLQMDDYLPLRDVVYNTLREAILKGELKPGERLMEMHLATKLGVHLLLFVFSDPRYLRKHLPIPIRCDAYRIRQSFFIFEVFFLKPP